MLAETVEFVLGVDTHSESHTVAVVELATQRLACQETVGADSRGYRDALRFAETRAVGDRVWALEGSGSYGAGLARFLAQRGERVLEVERPKRTGSRGRLKSDALDAERAARAVIAGIAGANPRIAPQTQALRVLRATREGAVRARTAAINELRALVVTAPPELRERLDARTKPKLVTSCLRLRPASDPDRAAQVFAIRSLARRIRHLDQEAKALEAEIAERAGTLAPELLDQPGVGPISAAAILATWSAPGRIHSEAAFARLAGTAPIPATSGKTIRHRLDRGGDRKANTALHQIIITLKRIDPNTQAYIARRLSEGKTEREAIRCLKRYKARSLYRLLERTAMIA